METAMEQGERKAQPDAASVRKVRLACLPCRTSKRKCDHGRPCAGCKLRGLEQQCIDGTAEASACLLCAQRKVKCDKQKPCFRCIQQGRSEECIKGVFEGLEPARTSKGSSTLKRLADVSEVSGPDKRQRLLSASMSPETVQTTNRPESDFACMPCRAAKRKCDKRRPCTGCIVRGLEAQCFDGPAESSACLFCIRRRVKCDSKKPCHRCVQEGRGGECAAGISAGGVTSHRHSPADSAAESPLRELSQESDSCSGSSTPRDRPFALVPGSPSRPPILRPENPFPFPDGTFNGWTHILPSSGKPGPWPKSLVRLFKAYRTADGVYERILANMPPKLLSTVLRVFRALDTLTGSEPEPTQPREWLDSTSWQSSLRCGMQTVRVDKNCGVMSGVDVNPFWTDLAGLHREEFVNRAFNGELNLPTSELRQVCKLLRGACDITKLMILQQQPEVELKPVYGRFTRNWGRGGQSEGVLIRMRTKTKTQMVGGHPWLYLYHSLVVVSAEEYEAVRRKDPVMCEGYVIPIVGSKSAAELMDPRLLEEESFAWMSASSDGRVQLDRLADTISAEWQFLFDALVRKGLGHVVEAQ